MKIAILIGTRPGIIKMTPLVHECKKRNIEHIVIHTGQHYSDNMDAEIMEDAGLEKVHYQINRPEHCTTHAQQTAYMLTHIEEVLMKEKPDILLVCGDANTNLSGALAARKLHVKVGHVEAGLRSFDWRMPEEHNRIIIDHISEYLFAPTEGTKEHLVNDGVNGEIYVVGNTIVDATLNNSRKFPETVKSKLNELTNKHPYVVMTSHREENVDNRDILENFIEALEEIDRQSDLQIIFPAHPRTKKRLKEFGLEERIMQISTLKITNPFGYKLFLCFLKNAEFVMTDSGGIQEETCILKTPCMTLRDNTERPETVEVGANQIVGTQKEDVVHTFLELEKSIGTNNNWENPFGDGQTSSRIIEACLEGSVKKEFGVNVS